jgi:hypothetical protein
MIFNFYFGIRVWWERACVKFSAVLTELGITNSWLGLCKPWFDLFFTDSFVNILLEFYDLSKNWIFKEFIFSDFSNHNVGNNLKPHWEKGWFLKKKIIGGAQVVGLAIKDRKRRWVGVVVLRVFFVNWRKKPHEKSECGCVLSFGWWVFMEKM